MTTLTDAEYRAIPALSGSAISDLLRSPAVYRWRMDHPTPATDAMKLGTLVHALVLGQPSTAVVSPFADFRTKEAREWRDTQTLDVVTQDAWNTAHAMAAAVAAHATASELLSAKGQSEIPLLWQEGDTPCKGKLDRLPNDGPVVDLKTTASLDDFDKSIGGYGYHAQGMHYRRGALANGHPAHERPVFIVVESTAPFRVQVFRLSEADAAQGEAMCEEAYRRYADCITANSWPSGLPDGITETDIPLWAYKQWDKYLANDAAATVAEFEALIGAKHD